MMTEITRLYLIRLAEGRFPDGRLVPLVAYLLHTSDHRRILIDTGLRQEHIIPQITIMQFSTIVEELQKIKVRPEDIDILITSHLDRDHTGFHASFPNATIVIQQACYDSREDERFQITSDQWDQPFERFQLVQGDVELLPGLQLLLTPGHKPGHQSVLVRLPESGSVLLAIDAIPDVSYYRRDREMGPMDQGDLALVQASTTKLIEIAEREQAQVIFGHDGEQWAGLRRSPEYLQ